MSKYNIDELVGIYLDANPGVDESTARTMAAIAMAESSGRPDATNRNTNGSIDRGLWQINSVWLKDPDFVKRFGNLTDPATNARAAEYVRGKQGLTAWSTYKHGTYNKFLSAVKGLAVKNPFSKAADKVADKTGDAVGGAIERAFSPVTGFLSSVPKMLLRFQTLAGLALLAAILIILGVVVLLRESDAGRAATGLAVKAATKTV